MAGGEQAGARARLTRRALLRAAGVAAAAMAAGCVPAPSAAPAAKPAAPAGAPLPAVTSAPSPVAAPTVAREPDVVKQGNVGTAFSTWIAKDRGYFAEVGIDLQDEPFATGAQMTPLLAAGQLDVGTTSMQSAFFNAVSRGVVQRMVVDKGHQQRGTATSVLAVRSDLVPPGGTLPLAEIRGRAIAVTTDPKAGGQGFLLVKMLAIVGLTMDDVDWKTIPYRDMPDLMANRQVDGAVLVEPFYTLSAQRAPLVMWQNLSDYYDGQQTAAYVFGEQFITQRTDVGRRWMVANLRAVRDYHDWQRRGQPADDLAEILARWTSIPIELVTQAKWEHMNPDGYLNVPAIEADQRQLLEWGAIAQLVPMDQVVDHQFVDYALAQLGRARG
jgi:ABC-type nitrate/sulfonate/bicarbonate transport system substrate-binding protein